MTTNIPTITLNDETIIPALGFGTASLKGSAGAKMIEHAIRMGYRLIDTAYNYENEGAVGEAIKNSHIPREELMITSKLPGRYQEKKFVIQTIEESLFRLNLDYLDLYLIHWPNPQQGHYVEAWEAMIQAKEKGLVRSIGVCNFLPEHLETLEKETSVLPSINQIELHPYFNQAEQRQYHEEKNIQTESWSPLVRTDDILNNIELKQIAQTHQKSIAQIILRWHYQIGSVAIPRSSNHEHQLQNMHIFDFQLSGAEMEQINQLSKGNGRINNQNPAKYEEF